MNSTSHPGKIGAYLKKNWFQIGLIALLVYAFFQKDLSFQINLKNPSSAENPVFAQKERRALAPETTARLNHAGSDELKKIPDFATLLSARQHLQLLKKEDTEAYLKRFAHVAVSERKKFGIPASIILANALLQSGGGQNEIARKGSNHFRLKCGREWDGEAIKTGGECYRKYVNAWSSFRDHSLFLSAGEFKILHKLDVKDYRGWATGLERLGYSDESGLAETLVQIIEKYRLDDLDAR
ncbi:MAG TPA: glucosaminidase domain-containing protein [Saprospiraceae bacterium]|nr:glucosaminidase domain-containing protein [Saprospiraceae bacterium]